MWDARFNLHMEGENINEAFANGIYDLIQHGKQTSSKHGSMNTGIESPVTITIRAPRERVFHWPGLDVSPFALMAEGLWCMAGRNDAAFISEFDVLREISSDDGETLHGAIGYRWFHHHARDQVRAGIKKIKDDPHSNFGVISVWGPTDDGRGESKDIPNAVAAVFRVAGGQRLDMTVTYREFNGLHDYKNLCVWTFLQEYIATALSVRVGILTATTPLYFIPDTHFSNLRDRGLEFANNRNLYLSPKVFGSKTVHENPLIPCKDVHRWDSDLRMILTTRENPQVVNLRDGFLRKTAAPVLRAWRDYTNNDHEAAEEEIEKIECRDWQVACRQYIDFIETPAS